MDTSPSFSSGLVESPRHWRQNVAARSMFERMHQEAQTDVKRSAALLTPKLQTPTTPLSRSSKPRPNLLSHPSMPRERVVPSSKPRYTSSMSTLPVRPSPFSNINSNLSIRTPAGTASSPTPTFTPISKTPRVGYETNASTNSLAAENNQPLNSSQPSEAGAGEMCDTQCSAPSQSLNTAQEIASGLVHREVLQHAAKPLHHMTLDDFTEMGLIALMMQILTRSGRSLAEVADRIIELGREVLQDHDFVSQVEEAHAHEHVPQRGSYIRHALATVPNPVKMALIQNAVYGPMLPLHDELHQLHQTLSAGKMYPVPIYNQHDVLPLQN